MDIEKIGIAAISAVIGSVVGGVVKYLFDRISERKKDKKEKITKLNEQRKERPEFVITEMKDYFNRPGTCINSNSCDLEVFVANIKNVNVSDKYVLVEFDDCIYDKKSWVCRKYTFTNVGKTVVYGVDIISNYKKTTCIFNAKSIDKMGKPGFLNYSELLDKRIAPNESFTLKICYHKERIQAGFFTAALDIGIRDDNNNYWVQPFFAPENKLYGSTKIDYHEYRDLIRPDDAIECFCKPYLW